MTLPIVTKETWLEIMTENDDPIMAKEGVGRMIKNNPFIFGIIEKATINNYPPMAWLAVSHVIYACLERQDEKDEAKRLLEG